MFELTVRILVLMVCGVFSALVRGQEAASPSPDESRWHVGYELFQMLLEERGLTVLETAEEAFRSPQSTTIVMTGDLRSLMQRDWLSLRRFAENGGTVLLASDSTSRWGGFHGGPVIPQDPEDHYQGFQDCVQVRRLQSRHPLMEGVQTVIANRCGWLTPLSDGALRWEVVARLPDDCTPAASSGQPLIMVGQISSPRGGDVSGSIILAADQSLFINNMLWHGDNAILAVRISDLLCRGSRTRLLFVSDGEILPSYRDSPVMPSPQAETPPVPPLPEQLPEPELQTLVRLANSVIRNVEESNILNETLMNQPRHVRQPLYLQVVLMVLTCLAGLLLAWRVSGKSLLRPQPLPGRQMLPSGAVDADSPTAGSQFGAAAEILAAELCRELTGSDNPADWSKQLHQKVGSKNPVSPHASSAMTRVERRNLATVLELAINGRKAQISRRRFQQIGRTIQRMRTRGSSRLS